MVMRQKDRDPETVQKDRATGMSHQDHFSSSMPTPPIVDSLTALYILISMALRVTCDTHRVAGCLQGQDQQTDRQTKTRSTLLVYLHQLSPDPPSPRMQGTYVLAKHTHLKPLTCAMVRFLTPAASRGEPPLETCNPANHRSSAVPSMTVNALR